MALKIGDKVTWNIRKGVNPKGVIVEILEDYGGSGYTRYVVKATEDITFTGKYGTSEIKKGDLLQPFKLKKIK